MALRKSTAKTGSNYKVGWKVINTAEHGVPQIRERVFMVGSRDGQELKFPEPAFAAPDALKDDLFAKVSPVSHGVGCSRRSARNRKAKG